MKKSCIVIALLLASIAGYSQGKVVEKIKVAVTKSDLEAHMGFLASDEMRGRDTGSHEIDIAASYLIAQFQLAGLKTVPGMTGFVQNVRMSESRPPKTLELKLGNDYFKSKFDLLLLKGKSIAYDGDIVFIGYGSVADFAATDVKGKLVVTYTGFSEKGNVREAIMTDGPVKYKLAKEKGAVGLIEIVTFTDIPWERLVMYLSGPRVSLEGDEKKDNDMPHLYLRKSNSEALTNLIEQKVAKGPLVIETAEASIIPGKNVIGLVEGTDVHLKKEYIVLSAHYDHIGIQKNGTADSIYNGARDNALGTTAIIEAAKFLVKNPSKRSFLIVAYCGEEKGLLGSRWYADHPVVPLNETVYNLDCDGAGYNDKSIVTLIDLNRTTADELLKKGVAAFGLILMGDPVPSENLYERSDNYNFAVKGIPAVDFSPGVKGFDAELLKYYHQAADEVGSLDFDYLEKFVRCYVYASWLVGNSSVRPTWKAGDKFEAEGKKLYGR